MSCLNYNRAIIGGKLTADPELKTTSGGTTVTSFSVAINGRKDKATGKQDVTFINVVAWREKAEVVTRYLRKGSSILVEGRIQVRAWSDRDGNKRYATEILADNIHFVDSRGEVQTMPNDPAAYVPDAYAMPQSAPQMEEVDSDEDLPF